MLDLDLAQLYGVRTMRLTAAEYDNLKSQFGDG